MLISQVHGFVLYTGHDLYRVCLCIRQEVQAEVHLSASRCLIVPPYLRRRPGLRARVGSQGAFLDGRVEAAVVPRLGELCHRRAVGEPSLHWASSDTAWGLRRAYRDSPEGPQMWGRGLAPHSLVLAWGSEQCLIVQ